MIEAIIIQGPTASGKTELAIEIAKKLNTEIVSFDSRQFYREMNIGSAKPTLEQRELVTHHFIDNTSLAAPMNLAQYIEQALPLVQEKINRFGTVVLCGGSNQFIDALIYGIDPVPVFPEIKKELEALHRSKGLEYVQELLKELDPVIALKIDLKNARRVIRALEVFMGSGQSISCFQSSNNRALFRFLRFGISTERPLLYNRINSRVENMISEGLEEEVRSLKPYWGSEVFRTVGYREWIPYFEGKIDRLEAIDKIKQNTRNYAKRQITWLKKYRDIRWIEEEGLEERFCRIMGEIS